MVLGSGQWAVYAVREAAESWPGGGRGASCAIILPSVFSQNSPATISSSISSSSPATTISSSNSHKIPVSNLCSSQYPFLTSLCPFDLVSLSFPLLLLFPLLLHLFCLFFSSSPLPLVLLVPSLVLFLVLVLFFLLLLLLLLRVGYVE